MFDPVVGVSTLILDPADPMPSTCGYQLIRPITLVATASDSDSRENRCCVASSLRQRLMVAAVLPLILLVFEGVQLLFIPRYLFLSSLVLLTIYDYKQHCMKAIRIGSCHKLTSMTTTTYDSMVWGAV